MSDLADLKRRVEEAQEDETWELIRLVGEHLGVRDSEDLWWGKTISPLLVADAYLDAAVALIERVKPGFARHVAYIPNIPTRKTDAEAKLWLPVQQTRGWKKETFIGEGKTEALALLAALLSACEQGGVK